MDANDAYLLLFKGCASPWPTDKLSFTEMQYSKKLAQ